MTKGANAKERRASRRPPLVPVAVQHRLLQMISAAPNQHHVPEQVAKVCLRMILELTGAAGTALYVKHEQTQDVRCMAVDGCFEGDARAGGRDLVTAVMERGQSQGHDELMGLPLKRGRTVQGVLLLQGLPPRPERDGGVQDLLDTAAQNLAASVDHARLAQKYAQKIVRIQQLEKIGEILSASSGETQSLQAAMEAILVLVDADAGGLLLIHDDTGALEPWIITGQKTELFRGGWQGMGHALTDVVVGAGKPLNISLRGEENGAPDRQEGMAPSAKGIHALLAVPVRTRNTFHGVLAVINKRGGEIFSNWDLLELSSVSNQVAYVLENGRLLRQSHDTISRLCRLQEIGELLNSTLDQSRLRNRTIEAATRLMDAEAGSLLLLDEPRNELFFDVALGDQGECVRQIRLKVGEGIAGYVAATGEPVVVHDVQRDPRFSRSADKQSGFTTRNMVCVPVRVREKLVGVLQAINKRGNGRFSERDLQDFLTLSHQVGIAVENANLYEEINRLFEGFISASVTAIESRDPTTSGHSHRVAVLTCELAEAVTGCGEGPYAPIAFSAAELRELRYAAILHDFGKVGVREHVLTKANKLFPGDFALIRARFDFITRTLELRACERKLDILRGGPGIDGNRRLADIDAELSRSLEDTSGILTFIEACNRPTVLKQDGFDRLHDIAGRHFDYFGEARPYLTPQEMVYLSIPRGSLTQDERLEIESHVTHTFRFLSTIPWTTSLKNVPLYAHRHHEKLDGTGYPLRMSGEQIPVQSRLMAICDIFDALTASDRPYKTAVPIAKALAILEEEASQGKLDQDLLEIFVDQQVYHRLRIEEGNVHRAA